MCWSLYTAFVVMQINSHGSLCSEIGLSSGSREAAHPASVSSCGCRSHDRNKAEFTSTMTTVDAELDAQGGPFFLGKDLSLVDVVFAPFLERIAASILYYKGLDVRGSG